MKRLFVFVLTFVLAVSSVVTTLAWSYPASAERHVSSDGEWEYILLDEGAVISKYCGEGGDLVIPGTLGDKPVVGIGDYAFECRASEQIRSVVVPEGVREIGERAFWECTSIESVTLPDTVTSIGNEAFYMCSSLKSFKFPESALDLGSGILSFCTSLKSVTLPSGMKTLPGGTFAMCHSLTDVELPEGLKRIGTSAFNECMSLKSIRIPDTVSEIFGAAFTYCFELESIEIPEGVIQLYDMTFRKCSSLRTVTLPSTLNLIGPEAFDGCDNLEEVIYKKTLPTWWRIPKMGGNSPLYKAKIVCAEDPQTVDSTSVFTDVSRDSWFRESVDFMYTYGLMKGISDRSFAPEAKTSRAMLVTILWRIEGSPLYGESEFTDLTDDWYRDAVNWAYAKGIIKGISSTEFCPNEPLSREQIVTIMYRYSELINYDVRPRASLDSFPDREQVDDYAVAAMKWAIADGLIKGTVKDGSVYLDPLGEATRAQVAAILQRRFS